MLQGSMDRLRQRARGGRRRLDAALRLQEAQQAQGVGVINQWGEDFAVKPVRIIEPSVLMQRKNAPPHLSEMSLRRVPTGLISR
jgi:hypothetical protein